MIEVFGLAYYAIADSSPGSFLSSPVADPKVCTLEDVVLSVQSPLPTSLHPEGDDLSKAAASKTSYLGALNGSVGHSESAGQQWIPVGVSDIVTNSTNGIKSLSLSQGFKEKLCKPWSHSVVVRLLGKSIRYSYLCQRLRAMWKTLGTMHIVDLGKSCFLVKFSVEQDCFKALTGGSWILLDHYLVVHQWEPSFRVLTSLGNLIGKTVRIDFNTQIVEHGKFSRMAVEIDLDKPLPPIVLLDGVIQQVKYENIPNLCFKCGRVGHDKGNFPQRVVISISDQHHEQTPPTGIDTVPPLMPTAENYGPWMVVSHRSHRTKK
ncbi:hypothetical protein LINPERHAP1_LOCUS1540 [Linum perenne]